MKTKTETKYTGMNVVRNGKNYRQAYKDGQLVYDDLAGHFLTSAELHIAQRGAH